MELLKAYLRECILERAFLKEAAITAEEAEVANLALYSGSPPKTGSWDNATNVFILYSPQALLDGIKSKNINSDDVIFGAISLLQHSGECNNAFSVLNVAAVKGYGPLMYNIAGTGKQITPHRKKGGVKAGAKKIWDYFYNGGTEAIPFDDPLNPKDENPVNDCPLHGEESLDHSYKGISANSSQLSSAHSDFVNKITEYGIDENKISEMIEKLGNEFYFDRFLSSPF